MLQPDGRGRQGPVSARDADVVEPELLGDRGDLVLDEGDEIVVEDELLLVGELLEGTERPLELLRRKVVAELRKILARDDLAVSCTATRVPVKAPYCC